MHRMQSLSRVSKFSTRSVNMNFVIRMNANVLTVLIEFVRFMCIKYLSTMN